MLVTIHPRMSGTFHANAGNDPLVGTQEHPDQLVEAMADPETEAAVWPTTGAPEKSRVLAGVLGLFLGGIGAHRFYLGFHSVAACQLAAFLLTVGATIIYGSYANLGAASIAILAIGTTVPVCFWGAVEGFMILGGMMPHDGHAHPLK